MVAFFIKKTRVLIFGTGAGGVHVYKSCRGRYNVIGFLDNNQQKQGHLLFGKPIHAPQKLKELVFDKIIIASDYYREIYQQVVSNLAIDERLVSVFHNQTQSPPSLLRRVIQRLETAAYERMCKHPGWGSDGLFRIFFRHDNDPAKSVKRLTLNWLDEMSEHKVHVFRPAVPGQIQGPRYIGRSVQPKEVILPEVALYHFKLGQACSVSRSIVLPGDRLVTERVTTSTTRSADYSGAHLLFHGQTLALVRYQAPEHIEKGILITGCNEVNYYHWVLETLSQLQFVAELPGPYADYPILISTNSQTIASIKALVDSMGIQRDFIFLDSLKSYKIADLLLISAPNNLIHNLKGAAWSAAENSFARPESIRFLREKAFSLTTGVSRKTLPTRIFLARKGDLRAYNQTQVLSLLEPHGFVPVYMEDHEVSYQIAIMANAEIIVGPTGAAWTNILFASKGAKALCWMAEEWGELSCFSNLAALVGVDMQYTSYRAGVSDTRALYFKEYCININIIETWLQRCLSPSVVGEA